MQQPDSARRPKYTDYILFKNTFFDTGSLFYKCRGWLRVISFNYINIEHADAELAMVRMFSEVENREPIYSRILVDGYPKERL